MFYRQDTNGYERVLEGVEKKTLVYGVNTLMTEFRLAAGSNLPSHDHPHEQTGYLVKGRLRMFVGDDAFLAEAGDAWCIPGNVTHSAEVLEDSIAVEVFSPVRADYLPQSRGG